MSQAKRRTTEKRTQKKGRPTKKNKVQLEKIQTTSEQTKIPRTFGPEIAKMMYVFGDSRYPLEDSIRIIEDFVRNYVLELVSRSEPIAFEKGNSKVDVEDVMFLFRHDEEKIKRICRFLNLKQNQKMKLKQEQQQQQEQVGTKRKRLEQFYSFKMFKPDVASTIIDLSDDEEESAKLDESAMRRLTAADAITKNMTIEEFLDYSKCRETSFNGSLKRFKEWVDFASYDMKVSDVVVDALSYIAWETVGVLVQTALIVRRDMALKGPDEAQVNIGIATGVMSPEKRKKLSMISDDMEVSSMVSKKQPLEPVHFYEAIRRLTNFVPSVTSFTAKRDFYRLV